MMGEPLPTGKQWNDALRRNTLTEAIDTAKQLGEKRWFRIWGYEDHRFEVWPGGRSVAYPLSMLTKRAERQAAMAAGQKCRHAWEVHTYSDPVAAGMNIEEYKQCMKCGEIK